MMAIQELYNKLRLTRECAKEQIVLNVSLHELETLMFGLKVAGADVDKGYEYVLSVKGKEQMTQERTNQLLKLIGEGGTDD